MPRRTALSPIGSTASHTGTETILPILRTGSRKTSMPRAPCEIGGSALSSTEFHRGIFIQGDTTIRHNGQVPSGSASSAAATIPTMSAVAETGALLAISTIAAETGSATVAASEVNQDGTGQKNVVQCPDGHSPAGTAISTHAAGTAVTSIPTSRTGIKQIARSPLSTMTRRATVAAGKDNLSPKNHIPGSDEFQARCG